MSDRVGDWIQTFTGKRFWPLDPRPEDLAIEDIAHALAMKCRFGGHCSHFYSVAEHSVLVSRHLPEEHKLAGLLHDAAEAYLADIPRPVKPHLNGWKPVEDAVEVAIAEHFGVYWPWHPEVKRVDDAIVLTEGRLLMGGTDGWNVPGEPLALDRLPLWPPQYAARQFLSEFRRLTMTGIAR